VRVVEGGEQAQLVAGTLSADHRLTERALPLDFTRFEVANDGQTWVTGIELMGATLVKIAFPPMRSYVRLYPDQRDALVGTLTELERALRGLSPGSPAG
jgi:hypothetical protein